MRLQHAVNIDSPAELVWARLGNVELWPRWTPSVQSVERLSGFALSRGSLLRIKQPGMTAMTWQVTDVNPGHSFTWRTSAPGIVTTASHVIEVLDAGSVRVTLSLQHRGPLALLAVMLSRRSLRYMRMEADGLRQACERRFAQPRHIRGLSVVQSGAGMDSR